VTRWGNPAFTGSPNRNLATRFSTRLSRLPSPSFYVGAPLSRPQSRVSWP